MPTEISGDHAARALFALLDLLARHNPGGWVRSGEAADTRLFSIGAPLASFNGVFRPSAAPSPGDIRAYAELAELPWSVFSAASPSPSLRAAAAASGLTETHLSRVLALTSPPSPPGFTVRPTDDRPLYLDVLAAGFEAPREIFEALMSPALMAAPGITPYLVEVDGKPVAAALGTLAEGLIGVWNVATPPEFRRRGYGRAATAAVVRDGFAAGATGAYLLSSDMGMPLYLGMGFQPVATWTHLVAA